MNEKPMVPYIVHEAEMARQERNLKRSWILCIIIFLALIGTNAAWLYYESQWEDVVTTETYQDVTQDADGIGSNMFVGGDYNGEAESENKN